jgi:hypothetical protein
VVEAVALVATTEAVRVMVVLVVLVFVLLLSLTLTHLLLQAEQLPKPILAETTFTHLLVLEPSLSNLFKEQSTWHISQK